MLVIYEEMLWELPGFNKKKLKEAKEYVSEIRVLIYSDKRIKLVKVEDLN
jgi:hypothetical protein